MKNANLTRTGVCVMALLCVWLRGTAAAQVKFDPHAYEALADASSAATIPPGTKITVANWKQYKQFMPVALQAEFAGTYFWKIGPGPEYTAEVGPTHHFPMAKKFLEDTEKYGKQAKLVALPDGGYTIDGDVAGLPFPNPDEPERATKIMYNTWLTYYPFILDYWTRSYQIDQYLNVTSTYTRVTYYRLTHLSTPGMPTALSYGKGYLTSFRYFISEPEQTKYTTEVGLQPDDPSKVQESYVFLPSLRRSLRLSSAARCAPTLGSDWVEDDSSDGFFFQLSNFSARLLGEKKILIDIMDPVLGHKTDSYMLTGTAPGWPKAGTAKWELRDQYVLDVTPLPKLGNYCYAHKVFYIDKETWIRTRYEIYDSQGKLWKLDHLHPTPQRLSTGEVILMPSVNAEHLHEFQNSHITTSFAGPVTIDKEVEPELQDAQVWAFPGSLSRIMR